MHVCLHVQVHVDVSVLNLSIYRFHMIIFFNIILSFCSLLLTMISKFFATHFRFMIFFFYENRTTATNIEGLCIVLRRLAYPSRLDDLEPVFGRSKAEISYIFNYVLDFCTIEERWDSL
jgi:hypothetical protein